MHIDDFNTLFTWEAYDLKEWIAHMQAHAAPVITPLTWIKMIYGNSLDQHFQRFGWFELLKPDADAEAAFFSLGYDLAEANQRLPLLCLFLAGAASPAICQVNRFEDRPLAPVEPVVKAGLPQVYIAAYAPCAPTDSGEMWAMAVYQIGPEGRGIVGEYVREYSEWFEARADVQSLYAKAFLAGYAQKIAEAVPA